jgi:hypothetical protein
MLQFGVEIIAALADLLPYFSLPPNAFDRNTGLAAPWTAYFRGISLYCFPPALQAARMA